ncbi:MAG: hypothetical protein WCE54_16790 [Ignavibacteriaceae bacterium]
MVKLLVTLIDGKEHIIEVDDIEPFTVKQKLMARVKMSNKDYYLNTDNILYFRIYDDDDDKPKWLEDIDRK